MGCNYPRPRACDPRQGKLRQGESRGPLQRVASPPHNWRKPLHSNGELCAAARTQHSQKQIKTHFKQQHGVLRATAQRGRKRRDPGVFLSPYTVILLSLCPDLLLLEGHQASLVAQLVKNPPAMQEIWVRSWVGKIPWKKERLPTPVFWPGEFHGLYSP